jgi:hypothetical protein
VKSTDFCLPLCSQAWPWAASNLKEKYRLLLQYPQDKKDRFGNRQQKIRKIYNEKTAVIP